MNRWMSDLVGIIAEGVPRDIMQLFPYIETAANALDFEFVSYVLRAPLPINKSQFITVNNFALIWQEEYSRSLFGDIDPIISHGCQTTAPLTWNAEIFTQWPKLRATAERCGVNHGWTCSYWNVYGGGIFSLARNNGRVTAPELAKKEVFMRWLSQAAHHTLGRALASSPHGQRVALTDREMEVLKWQADGKTSKGDIQDFEHLARHSTVPYEKCCVKATG